MCAFQTDFGPDSGGRTKNICVVKPIVYGNTARYFGHRREEDGHTHQWTVYVRPYHNEDMSSFIKKVHFKLHETYLNPNRIVTKPPYEITETGWGEFEIIIEIYFNDPNERPVIFYHILKLFQTSATSGIVVSDTNNVLVSETYDEIIFQEPTQLMHCFLMNAKQLTLGVWKHETDFEEKKRSTLKKILNTKNQVKNENEQLRVKIKLFRETIAKFKAEIANVEMHNSNC